MSPNITIVIPAFNEESTIADVIKNIKLMNSTIIVVDDGSTDETAKVAQACGAHVISLDQNAGYDRALYSGFLKSIALEAKIVVTIDADGQHSPNDIKNFIECFNKEDIDFVIGIRPKAARLAEIVFKKWVFFRFGIEDILCGLKAFRIAELEKYVHCTSEQTFGTGIAMKMASSKHNFAQLPIEINDRLDTPRIGKRFKANILIFAAMFRAITI